jgi:dipeptidase
MGMVNDHSVAIGETTFDGLEELSGTGTWDYFELMEMALKSATTAKEMIHVMDEIVKQDGYGATGESFTIADPNEIWHMELIGKGKRDKGWVWVAVRVPDGHVGGHANQARIRTFPLDDPDNCIYSEDVIDFAVEAGLYPADAPKEAFSFADVYDPISFEGARRCDARVWYFFSQLGDPEFEGQYQDYAMGHNLTNRMPLFIKPREKVDLTSFFHYTRHHYEGSALDSTNDISAGAHHGNFRPPPNDWTASGHSFVNERPVGVPYAAWSYVGQLRSDVPKDMGAINWWGADDSSYAVRIPLYGCTTRVPTSLSHESAQTMNFDSAFWVNSMIANMVYYRNDQLATRVLQSVTAKEQDFMKEIVEDDKHALDMWSDNKTGAIEYLTSRAEARANNQVKDWLAFYKELFMTHMDGLSPKGQQQGYAADWYARVAEETGDRYRDVTLDTACEHNQRKNRLLSIPSRAVSRMPRQDNLLV